MCFTWLNFFWFCFVTSSGQLHIAENAFAQNKSVNRKHKIMMTSFASSRQMLIRENELNRCNKHRNGILFFVILMTKMAIREHFEQAINASLLTITYEPKQQRWPHLMTNATHYDSKWIRYGREREYKIWKKMKQNEIIGLTYYRATNLSEFFERCVLATIGTNKTNGKR